MEDGWQQTPPELRQVIIVLGCLCHFLISFARHLNQTQDTADGNHHANKYMKNTDPDNVSLFGGRSYFPEDSIYRAYIKNLGPVVPGAEEVRINVGLHTVWKFTLSEIHLFVP